MGSPALRLALVVSVTLHALLALTLRGVVPDGGQAEASDPFEVTFVPRQEPSAPVPEEAPVVPVPDRQIVSPPDSPEAPPEEETRFLSDRDSRAEEETVRRGDAGSQSPETEATEPSPRVDPPPRELAGSARTGEAGRSREGRPSSLPEVKDLFLPPSEAMGSPNARDGDPARTRDDSSPDALASVRRPDLLSGGRPGTPDFLPGVREGQFTLLNTKADRFAPFVRRVGLRVFQSFSSEFRREIQRGSVPGGQERLEVEAIMSPEGRRIEVFLRGRRGNLAADRVLMAVLDDRIFFDQNPPDEAIAEDGRIHFVFSLDAAVWKARDPASGAHRPGARWVFGAGLL